MSEDLELEEEVCRSVETEQERLDRQGVYGEIKRELVKCGIPVARRGCGRCSALN
jgi:hypothetical protein